MSRSAKKAPAELRGFPTKVKRAPRRARFLSITDYKQWMPSSNGPFFARPDLGNALLWTLLLLTKAGRLRLLTETSGLRLLLWRGMCRAALMTRVSVELVSPGLFLFASPLRRCSTESWSRTLQKEGPPKRAKLVC